jgi:hypothetical protein
MPEPHQDVNVALIVGDFTSADIGPPESTLMHRRHLLVLQAKRELVVLAFPLDPRAVTTLSTVQSH